MNHAYNILNDLLKDQYINEGFSPEVLSSIINKLQDFFNTSPEKVSKNLPYIEKTLSPIKSLIKKFPSLKKIVRDNLKKYVEKELDMRESDFIYVTKQVELYMLKQNMIPRYLKSMASTQALFFTLNTAYKLRKEIELIPTRSLVLTYAKQRLNLIFRKKGLTDEKENLRYLVVSLLIVGLVIIVAKSLPRGYSALKTSLMASGLVLPAVGIFMYAQSKSEEKEKE
jgi:hypothetical protein